MNSKEKAKDLRDKFEAEIANKYEEDMVVSASSYLAAIQCALIAVDEIVKLHWTDVNGFAYWQSVKQELEKL